VASFDFLLGSEDLVHHILIVVGRGGVDILDLVGWEEGKVKEGIGVGVVGIETSKDSVDTQKSSLQ
jgi:hypothetical protein